MTSKKIPKVLILVIVFLSSINIFSQYSKTHFIPPVTTQSEWGVSRPCQQYLYISTPSATPITVTIRHLGGITETNTFVSNNNPWDYYIGTGPETNLIINESELNSDPFNNKGFIIESDGLVYVSARLFSCAGDGLSPGFQAAALVSKGNAALGTEFRAGNFESPGEYFGGNGDAFLNFIYVVLFD